MSLASSLLCLLSTHQKIWVCFGKCVILTHKPFLKLTISNITQLLRYGQRLIVYPSGFLDGPDCGSGYSTQNRTIFLVHPLYYARCRHSIFLPDALRRYHAYHKGQNLAALLSYPAEIRGVIYFIADPPRGSADVQEARRGTVIMCHGNAMNHGNILHEARLFFSEGFDVFTLEYRG